MDVKILGSGCLKCQRLEAMTRETASELGVPIEVEHVRDVTKMMEYPIVRTPALVVDGDVKVSGRMPSKEEISAWLRHP